MEIQDWQKGNDSTTHSIERARLHDEWLKAIHKELKEKITVVKEDDNEIVLGFID